MSHSSLAVRGFIGIQSRSCTSAYDLQLLKSSSPAIIDEANHCRLTSIQNQVSNSRVFRRNFSRCLGVMLIKLSPIPVSNRHISNLANLVLGVTWRVHHSRRFKPILSRQMNVNIWPYIWCVLSLRHSKKRWLSVLGGTSCFAGSWRQTLLCATPVQHECGRTR